VGHNDKQKMPGFSVHSPEPKTYKFKARVILDESKPLQRIMEDVIESQEKKFNIVYDECYIQSLEWVPKETNTGSIELKSVIEIVIGPVQTDNSMDDISAKVHTGLEDFSTSCEKVYDVTCVDIVP
jgi:hypothetical protein